MWTHLFFFFLLCHADSLEEVRSHNTVTESSPRFISKKKPSAFQLFFLHHVMLARRWTSMERFPWYCTGVWSNKVLQLVNAWNVSSWTVFFFTKGNRTCPESRFDECLSCIPSLVFLLLNWFMMREKEHHRVKIRYICW